MKPPVERIVLETLTRGGKRRRQFLIDVWKVGEDWHWRLTNGKAAPSRAYPTREAAIEAARLKDGLDPNV